MIRSKLHAAAAAVVILTAAPTLAPSLWAQKGNPKVGGAAMYASKTIVENAAASPQHKTLVTAVQSAGLAETLSGAGPFTVFAPTDGAFSSLPAGTVDSLLLPENKAKLTSILTYHVVPGSMTAKAIASAIRAGKGKATLTTVQGKPLTARMTGGYMVLTDARGATAMVTVKDVMQSNGVIHVVDSVLMP